MDEVTHVTADGRRTPSAKIAARRDYAAGERRRLAERDSRGTDCPVWCTVGKDRPHVIHEHVVGSVERKSRAKKPKPAKAVVRVARYDDYGDDDMTPTTRPATFGMYVSVDRQGR